MDNLLSYQQVFSAIKQKLQEVDNLTVFSKKHGISYQILVKIKNKNLTKEYPLIIISLYHIFFKKQLIQKRAFEVRKK